MGCDTLLKDKYLLNPKSFMASTLKDLTELNCSKPTQPDHFETTTNPPPVDTDANFTPPTHPGHTEVQTNSSQTSAKDIENSQNPAHLPRPSPPEPSHQIQPTQ